MSPLLTMLQRHEGTGPMRLGRFLVYDDATGKAIGPGSKLVGHPTGGYGRALDLLGYSQEEADYLLTNDVVRVFKELRLMCPWFDGLDSTRQDALIDCSLNLGATKFLKFHDMLNALRDHAYKPAAAALLDSDAARKLPGRYHELAAMIEHGQYVVQV